MRLMSISDAFFLINESRETPMHVGGVNLYTLPPGVDEQTFLGELLDLLRQPVPLRPQFGDVLKFTALGQYGPIRFKPDQDIDLHYHVRHSALPAPGRYRELFELVSRLHGTLLDRSRPMWEMTVISGLQNRQFATYFKIHHALMDGVGAIHFSNSMLTPDPEEKASVSPFSLEAYERYRARFPKPAPKPRLNPTDFGAVRDFLVEQFGNSVGVSKALTKYYSAWLGMAGELNVPWRAVPRTSINRKISGARRFVAQSFSLERIRAVGKAFDGTINDAILGMCAGALRRYLLNQRELPDQPLKAMAPVSVRPKDDVDSANAIGFITANLGTHLSDPKERMAVIQGSMLAAKEQLGAMTAKQIQLYTALTQAPMLLASLSGTAGAFPAFSVVVSNVPGPREQMYWNGARLDGIYPANIPFDGFAMTITQISNNKNIDFGITACRRTVPQVQRMIDYLEEALVELEVAGGLAEAPAKGRKTGKRD
jgi:WS/DGAT/MGAT family acyltransferase